MISPGPRHIQQQNQSVSSGLWLASISSGTPAETVVPVRWMSESLPPRMEKLEQQHAAALHHGQQGPKQSPSDEQVSTHGLGVTSFKSLGTGPSLLCRVPSRQSLGHRSHSSVYSTALSSQTFDSLRFLGPWMGIPTVCSKQGNPQSLIGKGMWAGAPALAQTLLGVSRVGR